VESFADARAFLEAYRPERPGCLVLDLNMPGMSGLELQQYLKEQGVVIPVIFLSGRADIPRAVQAVREGAIDFIEKPFDYKRVVERVRESLERDRAERAGRDHRRIVAERLGQLTQREREVLDLVVAGKLNREIAETLDISIKTVEAHRARLMEKLEVGSLAELVQVVVAAG
jgi:RNA polymerase sigma factor (sigma-70 family)